jgi:hypothetical protein
MIMIESWSVEEKSISIQGIFLQGQGFVPDQTITTGKLKE